MDGMKRHMEVIREHKTGRLFTHQILKSYPHLRCYDFCLRYMLFLAFALDNSGCFYNWVCRRLSWKVQSKAKLVSSTFDKKGIIPYLSCSVLIGF